MRRRILDFSRFTVAGFLLILCCAPRCHAQAATISWTKVDQIIDGFGASDANEAAPLSTAQATLFFSATNGVGLSLLRTAVPDDGSCATVNATCAGEVSDMKFAIANGARVWSTPWSPPASMKSNASVNNGGSLIANDYGAYARYLANYVKSLSSLYGINLYALSVQNEPEKQVYYDSAVWTGAQFDTFIRSNLGPTFAQDGLTTLIAMPETAILDDFPLYADTSMNDSVAAGYVSIYATHDYSLAARAVYPLTQTPGKHIWQTEVSDQSTFDPSMTSALTYAQYIHDWMTLANANAWHYWWLIGRENDNQGLISVTGEVSKRLYAMGNFSKFVRPGYYRIDATATPQPGISISAYKNLSSGALIIVAINQNRANTSQMFTLEGATASTMTPWITDAGRSLIQQTNVAVTSVSFAYNLPASSITTFVGTTDSASPPAPPTGLTAKVQ
jgi:glucuronoarabinoxylan endo-1,4-beta-xylanase